jgi:predicted NAD/FAD-dependent oxidoreductase
MQADLNRRSFLALLAALGAAFLGFLWFGVRRREVTAELKGPDLARGHAIRTPLNPQLPSTETQVGTAIIGAGASGLSAAWYLQKQGYGNFRLYELENRAGGNSAWGQNRVGRYPWGAHYLPTPGEDAVHVRELLAEMGVLVNGKYGEEFLVHENEERLFIYNNWQPGLVPLMGARETDRAQIERFFSEMAKYRNLRGSDGRRAFTIPASLSSADERFTAFDRISADAYLKKLGITSIRLLWYIDYVLRDEYGANRSNTSAWAMLHYFASRAHGGAGADAATDGIGAAVRSHAHNLVWPEGNGRITEYLRAKIEPKLQVATALRHIERTGGRYRLHFQNHQTRLTETVQADNVIYAAPKFTLPYVYPELDAQKKAAAQSFRYSPWLTVNLLVNHFGELDPAWDNVTYGSHSLGYVVAEHQRSGKLPHARSLTFFHAFDADDTLASRRQLLSMTARDAYNFALAELSRPHPKIADFVEEVGVYRWAHAMIRPSVGFQTSKNRTSLGVIARGFYGAHSDISGMSNFEEAQFQGVTAAKRVLAG